MIIRLWRHMVEDIFRNISGPLGIRLRRFYYKKRFASCGMHVVIETGVYFQQPEYIHFGDYVWIDKNCIFIAGETSAKGTISKKNNSALPIQPGSIRIGSHSHIGINTVLQGHGGVSAGDFFTSSAGCRIYSFSNDYRNCHYGTMENTLYPPPAYIIGPVNIGKNVWLGLAVSIISTSIADNVFVMPHAVVYQPLESNTVAAGNPAVKIKNRFSS